MKVGILGAGSIGLLLAAKLSAEEVFVFTRTEIQAEEIRKHGITLETSETKTIHKVQAVSLHNGIDRLPEMDLIFVTVKQSAITDILPSIRGSASCLIFLQNGMGHLEYIQDLQVPSVYIGVVEHGALSPNKTTTIHNGHGVIRIGLYMGVQHPGVENLGDDTFPVEVVAKEELMSVLQEKLVINSVINPLTAVLGIKNGQLMQNQYYKELMKSVLEEVCGGLAIPFHEQNRLWKKVQFICQQTSLNTSSMLRDLELARKTEIDAILGYVVKEAGSRSVSAPNCQMLLNMIKGIEESGGYKWRA